jgi:hypothetical protein
MHLPNCPNPLPYKVGTLLDHAGHIHAVVVLTAGKRSDLTLARGLHLPVDSIVTMDRGYLDYQFLCRLQQEGGVLRHAPAGQCPSQRDGALCRRPSHGVTADHEMVLTGPKGRAYSARLR